MTMDNVLLDHSALATTSETPAVVLSPSPDLQDMDAHLETLAQEVAHLRLSLLTEGEIHQSTIKQLRRRLDILTVGIMLLVLGLMGAGTWFFSSPQGLALLRQPIATTATDDLKLKEWEQRIAGLQGGETESLISQVKTLEEQVKALDGQQTSVQALEAKVTELSKNANTRQQTITILAKALQDVINVEADPPSESAAEDPTNTSPVKTPQADASLEHSPENSSAN